MENQRSASLSLKQGFGVLTAMMGIMLILPIPFVFFGAIMMNLKKNDGNDLIPMLVGSFIGCIIVLAMGIGTLVLSIRLLKDPHGMIIPFLEKRFNSKK